MDIAGYDELRREQAEKRANGRADGHRPQLLHREASAPARASTWTSSASAWPTAPSCACTRPARPSLRLSVQTQGQGHETTFAQIVAQELGHPAGGHRGRPRRHRQHAVRPRHLRLALDAGVRRGRRGRVAAGPGQGAASSPPRCSSARPTTSSGRRAAGSCKGDPAQGKTIQEIALASHGTLELPEGVEGHLDALVRLRPAEPHLPVRRLHLRRRRRPRHRPGEGAPVHRRRRLRAADQPDDRRGPGARRPGRRRRHGAHGGDRLRRGRQLPRRLVHGLPAADVDGVPDRGSSARRSRRRRTTRSACKGVGESATVGSPAAVVNAVHRRPEPFGVRHADMPLTPGAGVAGHAGPPVPDRPGDRVSR